MPNNQYQFLYQPIKGTNGNIAPLKDWTVGAVIDKSLVKAYQTPRNPVYAIGLYLRRILGRNPKPEVAQMTIEAWAKKHMDEYEGGMM